MPIAKLFVEGNLEAEVFNPIFQGSPLLQKGGSKNSLRPRVRAENQQSRFAVGYLRDRDFDFDPPENLTTPTVDCEDGGIAIGWRWCRHELENYLIEPALINAAMAWPVSEIEDAICDTARQIRNYEAARWTVGIVRRVLPPHFELRTRPDNLNEIALPAELDHSSARNWALQRIDDHRDRMITATAPTVVQSSFDDLATRFDDAFTANVMNVLIWFSGKDILAGMADWLKTKSITNAGLFRALLRDWIIANPEHTLELLPEWKSLVQQLRA